LEELKSKLQCARFSMSLQVFGDVFPSSLLHSRISGNEPIKGRDRRSIHGICQRDLTSWYQMFLAVAMFVMHFLGKPQNGYQRNYH